MVISPLISLMKDQVTALKLRGIEAAFLNSSMDLDLYRETAFQAATGAYKILYVAPEKLQTPGFREMCLQMDIPLVAVDEAHCSAPSSVPSPPRPHRRCAGIFWKT